MKAINSTKMLNGLSEVIDNYSILFVDQWGVMHNGHNAFPDALNCLEKSVEKGCRIISVSNSSRNKDDSEQLLGCLGYIKGKHYHEVVTSGETVLQKLPYYRSKYGSHVWSINWTSEEPLLNYGDWIKEIDPARINWILCSGVPIGTSVNDFKDLFLESIKRNIPMVCANPDILTLSPDNSLNACPGAFAVFYKENGGKVYWHGKPLNYIYNYSLQQTNIPDTPRSSILGIGDSMHHDILGINDFGGSSCLIRSGIHNHEIPKQPGEQQFAIDKLAKDANTSVPNYILEELIWD